MFKCQSTISKKKLIDSFEIDNLHSNYLVYKLCCKNVMGNDCPALVYQIDYLNDVDIYHVLNQLVVHLRNKYSEIFLFISSKFVSFFHSSDIF